MRKLSLFATLVAGAVLVTALGAQLATAEHEDTIELNTRNIKTHEIYDNPDSDIGDKIVIVATLKEEGNIRGRLRQECTIVSLRGAFQCLATVSLMERGSVAAHGVWPGPAPTEKLGITGGTQEFENHGGSLHWDTEENLLRLDIRP